MQMPGGLNMGSEFAMGHKHGMAMLYGMVQRQAAMLSFNDIYRDPDRADADAGADVPVPQARHAQPAGRSGALKKFRLRKFSCWTANGLAVIALAAQDLFS